MSGPFMTRYSPARHYTYFGVVALALAIFSAWVGMGWAPAFAACAIFVFMASVLLLLAFRPSVEVQDPYLRIGKRMSPWIDVRRVDRTGWVSPLLAVRLTLYDDTRILVIYPGDIESCKSLLRTLRRMSRDALIDGIPYRQYWGEMLSSPSERRQLPSPRYRVLRPEDEMEIERLYQRLKTVGHLDPKNSSDEK
jgi:hypothetical protein